MALRLPPGSPPAHPPIDPPPNGFRTSKGPILRKSIDSFYFAAKAHGYLQLKSKNPASDLPSASTWNPVEIERDSIHETDGTTVVAGLLTAWYPEVGTLVLAYAAHEMPQNDTWVAPFYLPENWDCCGRKSVVEILNKLHFNNVRQANEQLKSFSNGIHPVRILVCGFSSGGALAAVAAPWVALAYPSADTELVTYGTGYVRNNEFMKLTQWALATRLPVVISEAEPEKIKGVDEKVKVPRVRLPGVEKIPGFPIGLGTSSIVTFVLALSRACHISSEIQTSGSGFCNDQFALGSFWGSAGYQEAVKQCAEQIRYSQSSNYENIALQWAVKLNLKGNPSPKAPVPSSQQHRLGFVYPSFSTLVPGRNPPYLHDELVRGLVARMLQCPGQFSEASYHRDIVPLQFLQAARLSGLPAALVSDSLSGADAYVAWDEHSGTLLLSFRGTEPYEVQDLITDADFLQVRGEIFATVDENNPAWVAVDPEAVQRERNAKVHRGFLAQFEALAGLPAFSWSDLHQPVSGTFRLLRYLAGQSVHYNHRNTPSSRNIAAVAHEMTGGRTPLRVICTGYSLGGALATLGGVYSALTWPEASISCFTFGSPLVGSSQFVEVFGQLVGRSVRAVHGKEIVPSVPPSFLRFQHVTPAVWLRPEQQPHLELYASGLTHPFGSRNIFPDHMMRNNNTTLEAAIAELDFVLGGAEDGGSLENRKEE